MTVHKSAETIQGRKLFKGGNYMRKYGIWTLHFYVFRALTILLILLFQAIRLTARYSGSSEKTIRNVIKEKLYFGDFIGRPYPKYKKSIFEKLTMEQKDAIRKAVIDI